jgi:hypothetical protein
MGLNYVKSIVGWIIVLGHLSIGAVVLLAKDNVFNPSQKSAVLLVLAPVFSIYFVAVVRSFIAGRENSGPGTAVNYNYVAIVVLLPIVQLAAAHYLVISYPGAIATDTQALQQWLSALEVFLGGTVGLIVENLFPKA